MARGADRARLPLSVILLGLVSLLTDASSEMIFPLLPMFLEARIPNAPLLLGAMEGVAELVASGTKWWSGRWADRSTRLKPMVVAGYTLAGVMRPLMAFVTRWWQPLLIRSVDRVGKGLRSSPRDALIARWVPSGQRGRAFGFHRGMDNGGAAIGSLIASALLAVGLTADRIFLWSAVPAALGVVALLFVKEVAPSAEETARGAIAAPSAASAAHAEAVSMGDEIPAGSTAPAAAPVSTRLEPMPARLWAYLVPVTIFGLANATDAFLLLLLQAQGAAPALLPLAWLLLHTVKSLVSFPAGRIADRIGTNVVVMIGWALYAISYAGLAWSPSWHVTLVVMAFYGLYHAFAEGAERALLADLAPAASRGRAFGAYYALAGVSALAGGLLFGAVWKWRSPAAAFLLAGGISAFALVLLVVLLPRARPRAPQPP